LSSKDVNMILTNMSPRNHETNEVENSDQELTPPSASAAEPQAAATRLLSSQPKTIKIIQSLVLLKPMSALRAVKAAKRINTSHMSASEK
jgi:hypothetical protein